MDTNSLTITACTAGEAVEIKRWTAVELWQEAWSMAGKSLFYMQYIHPEISNTSKQVGRIDRMCYHLAVEHGKHIEDTDENRNWFRDWIEEFADEVENQC